MARSLAERLRAHEQQKAPLAEQEAHSGPPNAKPAPAA